MILLHVFGFILFFVFVFVFFDRGKREGGKKEGKMNMYQQWGCFFSLFLGKKNPHPTMLKKKRKYFFYTHTLCNGILRKFFFKKYSKRKRIFGIFFLYSKKKKEYDGEIFFIYK